MDKAPKDGDEFKRILQALTRPQESQWGIAVGGASFFGLNTGSAFLGIFKTPNNWRLEPVRQVSQGLRDRGVQGRGRLRA